MTMPFAPVCTHIRAADLRCPAEVARIEALVAEHQGNLFQRPAWLRAVEAGTGQRARGLVAEQGGRITGWLPLSELHSPVFGRALVSSGFAVGGGAIVEEEGTAVALARAAQELAARLACTAIEVRAPLAAPEWWQRSGAHCGFVAPLAADDEAQLLAVPRKQRAELRRALGNGLEVTIGRSAADLTCHYAVYAQSVRNLGTPVFPRRLFAAMLDALDADILTVSHQGQPVASVLSFYHGLTVMPYWGGGTRAARALRANDRMYLALMSHARARGCTHFDFGRSKTGSGPWLYKKTWGFTPRPLTYSLWHAPGAPLRDADPASPRHAARIALWKRLPLPVANRLGPIIARGLG